MRYRKCRLQLPFTQIFTTSHHLLILLSETYWKHLWRWILLYSSFSFPVQLQDNFISLLAIPLPCWSQLYPESACYTINTMSLGGMAIAIGSCRRCNNLCGEYLQAAAEKCRSAPEEKDPLFPWFTGHLLKWGHRSGMHLNNHYNFYSSFLLETWRKNVRPLEYLLCLSVCITYCCNHTDSVLCSYCWRMKNAS